VNRPDPKLAIFTDLDGTFLDHHTYSFDPALPAYRRCQAAGIRVVFCSSKTRAEIERVRRRLESSDPFIVENGGAVFLPGCVIELGVRYDRLCATLDRISGETGIAVDAFHHLEAAQIAWRMGLSLEDAAAAAAREYDEPFVFREASAVAVRRFLDGIEGAGLRWTRGGRFHHVFGHAGKGAAVERLLAELRRSNAGVVAAGLGDSVNDIPLLRAVQIAILVQRPDGAYEPEVLRLAPGLRLAPLPGPAGWNVAVQALLDERGIG